MLVLRKFKNEDIDKLSDMLKAEDIKVDIPKSNEMIYLSFSDEELMGAIKVKYDQDIWILDYLYIAEKWRNEKIGDGLLRVMVDKLDKKKIKTLYFLGENKYLIKRGFEENEDKILELDIENFFKDTCSSCDNCEV